MGFAALYPSYSDYLHSLDAWGRGGGAHDQGTQSRQRFSISMQIRFISRARSALPASV